MVPSYHQLAGTIKINLEVVIETILVVKVAFAKLREHHAGVNQFDRAN